MTNVTVCYLVAVYCAFIVEYSLNRTLVHNGRYKDH